MKTYTYPVLIVRKPNSLEPDMISVPDLDFVCQLDATEVAVCRKIGEANFIKPKITAMLKQFKVLDKRVPVPQSKEFYTWSSYQLAYAETIADVQPKKFKHPTVILIPKTKGDGTKEFECHYIVNGKSLNQNISFEIVLNEDELRVIFEACLSALSEEQNSRKFRMIQKTTENLDILQTLIFKTVSMAGNYFYDADVEKELKPSETPQQLWLNVDVEIAEKTSCARVNIPRLMMLSAAIEMSMVFMEVTCQLQSQPDPLLPNLNATSRKWFGLFKAILLMGVGGFEFYNGARMNSLNSSIQLFLDILNQCKNSAYNCVTCQKTAENSEKPSKSSTNKKIKKYVLGAGLTLVVFCNLYMSLLNEFFSLRSMISGVDKTLDPNAMFIQTSSFNQLKYGEFYISLFNEPFQQLVLLIFGLDMINNLYPSRRQINPFKFFERRQNNHNKIEVLVDDKKQPHPPQALTPLLEKPEKAVRYRVLSPTAKK